MAAAFPDGGEYSDEVNDEPDHGNENNLDEDVIIGEVRSEDDFENQDNDDLEGGDDSSRSPVRAEEESAERANESRADEIRERGRQDCKLDCLQTSSPTRSSRTRSLSSVNNESPGGEQTSVQVRATIESRPGTSTSRDNVNLSLLSSGSDSLISSKFLELATGDKTYSLKKGMTWSYWLGKFLTELRAKGCGAISEDLKLLCPISEEVNETIEYAITNHVDEIYYNRINGMKCAVEILKKLRHIKTTEFTKDQDALRKEIHSIVYDRRKDQPLKFIEKFDSLVNQYNQQVGKKSRLEEESIKRAFYASVKRSCYILQMRCDFENGSGESGKEEDDGEKQSQKKMRK
ncbi:hypothetical protein QAD02_007324 [Eretmocerus hayati]|uniref:Uncharacterized protein n=1 Tax=Eretmocerus hayati TaxID=131215 RepID=A0ACC2N3P5_9HYME|nr:hypothetical protein QAD02_007324 [Eretmocerus hayati]